MFSTFSYQTVLSVKICTIKNEGWKFKFSQHLYHEMDYSNLLIQRIVLKMLLCRKASNVTMLEHFQSTLLERENQ